MLGFRRWRVEFSSSREGSSGLEGEGSEGCSRVDGGGSDQRG